MQDRCGDGSSFGAFFLERPVWINAGRDRTSLRVIHGGTASSLVSGMYEPEDKIIGGIFGRKCPDVMTLVAFSECEFFYHFFASLRCDGDRLASPCEARGPHRPLNHRPGTRPGRRQRGQSAYLTARRYASNPLMIHDAHSVPQIATTITIYDPRIVASTCDTLAICVGSLVCLGLSLSGFWEHRLAYRVAS